MKKIKIEQYRIYEKGRVYEVLKFPFIRHMWAFDDFPEEDMLMVDGCKEVFLWMKYAFAILANYPEKILYFPCKQEGIGRYYKDNHHVVLCRPELQLRRSLWFRLKKKLDKRHSVEKFSFVYDRKKLDDFYEKGLWKRYPVEYWGGNDRGHIPDYVYGQQKEKHVEEIIGDTVFMVLGRVECFAWHYNTAKDLDEYQGGEQNPLWSAIGYIMSDEDIEEMYRETEEEKNKTASVWGSV